MQRLDVHGHLSFPASVFWLRGDDGTELKLFGAFNVSTSRRRTSGLLSSDHQHSDSTAAVAAP